jgi:ParB family transcriptional regulator, chromosome partitioning protein
MASSETLLDPGRITPNPENPRLIFRAADLQALQDSIKLQGILVPLTVYQDGRDYVILDGERRWRCALKLGLPRVPVIVQSKPDRFQNIMMMFAIHGARADWDPLPTAYKLKELEDEFTERLGRRPTETELAEVASMSRGQVRRMRQLLALPQEYRAELLGELEKPRSQQILTVDHVLEASKGAAALRDKGVIDRKEEEDLRRALVDKFKGKVETDTVKPRQLMRIARAVEREEVEITTARKVSRRLINEPRYTIESAFQQSVEQVDFEHGTEQLAQRLEARLDEHAKREYEVGQVLRDALARVERAIRRTLRSS